MQQFDLLIVGGGSAGWMAAALCSRLRPQWRIALVESERIGTIGVGEGSTPHFGRLIATLGLAESQWMPECDASFKTGIDFGNWGGDEQRYFHPFLSPMDLKAAEVFYLGANARRRGRGPWTGPDEYFIAARLARAGVDPVAAKPLPAPLEYGYHFDAAKLAALLRRVAESAGVQRIAAEVVQVHRQDTDTLAGVSLSDGQRLDASRFIDASGFAALLIGDALQVPFESLADKLLCDSAVTVATEAVSGMPFTRAEALEAGWLWQIPLASRTGNGYVYSSAHLSADEAAFRLRARLGLTPDVAVKHLSMKVGVRSRCWQGNVLAIGLAQGFVEPLEATSLMVTQHTLEQYLQQEALDTPRVSRQQAFNQAWRTLMDGIVDYIQAHYLCARRRDSEFWQTASQTPPGPLLSELLTVWRAGGDLDAFLHQHDSKLAYFRPSWYALLAGLDDRNPQLVMPYQPPAADLRAAASAFSQRLMQQFFTAKAG